MIARLLLVLAWETQERPYCPTCGGHYVPHAHCSSTAHGSELGGLDGSPPPGRPVPIDSAPPTKHVIRST